MRCRSAAAVVLGKCARGTHRDQTRDAEAHAGTGDGQRALVHVDRRGDRRLARCDIQSAEAGLVERGATCTAIAIDTAQINDATCASIEGGAVRRGDVAGDIEGCARIGTVGGADAAGLRDEAGVDARAAVAEDYTGAVDAVSAACHGKVQRIGDRDSVRELVGVRAGAGGGQRAAAEGVVGGDADRAAIDGDR